MVSTLTFQSLFEIYQEHSEFTNADYRAWATEGTGDVIAGSRIEISWAKRATTVYNTGVTSGGSISEVLLLNKGMFLQWLDGFTLNWGLFESPCPPHYTP
jgi:hypothetical protein